MKLERLLAKHQLMGRSAARQAILASRVQIDDTTINAFDYEVDRFARVTLDDTVVQAAARRLCLMLHKPVGVLSATTDAKHPTVIDLIDDPEKHTLHLVGRLDLNTSGLVLLTNDGRWSKALMHPDKKVPKTYLVATLEPIPATAPTEFEEGFYFETENLTTLPAKLEILTPHSARVTLHEGRYRQVRRMFHRVGCKVTALHRESIGDLHLPTDLPPGHHRPVPPELGPDQRP